MAVIIPPGYSQVSVEYRHRLYNRPAYNVLGWDGAAEYNTPDEAAQGFHNVWATHVGPQLDSDATIYSVRILVGQDGGDPIQGFSSTPQPGGAIRDSTSPAIAVRAIKRTALGGRRGRGSIFFPWFVGATQVTELGTLVGAATTQIQTRLDGLMGEFTDGFGLFLLHGTGITDAPAPSRINSLLLDQTISNQVRRQVRR